MKSDDLIKEFQQAKVVEKTESDMRLRSFTDLAERVFRDNVKIWLGDLYDEFTFGELKVFRNESNYPNSVVFELPVTWHDATGSLMLRLCKPSHRGYRHYDQPKLTFSFGSQWLRGPGPNLNHFNESLDLPVKPEKATELEWEYVVAAGMPDPVKFGEFLFKLKAELEDRANAIKASKDQEQLDRIADLKRGFAIDIHWWHTFDVAAHYDLAMEEFPTMAEEWGHLKDEYEVAVEKIKAAQEKQAQLDEQEASDRQAEENRLIEEAKKTWEPIVLYRVRYGAKIEGSPEIDEDPDWFTEHAIILDDRPDSDGWYYSVSHGLIQRITLPNVLRIDELVCMRPDDLPRVFPDGVFARKYLTSEKYPDIQVGYWDVLQEVTRLDLDAEVEQRR